MNAQLGAMVALGDLQRYTGPDQRVTARSDILLAPGISGIDGQERWTGVWSSKDSDPGEAGYQFDQLDKDDGLENHKARWLVSGNVSDPNASTLNPNVDFSGETVDLATIGGSVPDKTEYEGDTVKAPKVEILGENNSLSGHYAYWVSDEGVKARVNMADPFLDSDPYDPNKPDTYGALYRTAMAQVADPTAVTKLDGTPPGTISRWKDEEQDPGKISSLKNIPIFTENELPSDEFFHDFTVHSSGVLANTKDGGLKRDLSTALLALPNDLKGPMFDPAGGSVALGDPGGPKWEQLADYFSLAKSGSVTQVDFRMPTPEQVGVTPVVTRFNFVIHVFAERLSTASTALGYIDKVTDYQYYVGVFPLITLWNPYDKDLQIPDLGLQFDMRGIVLRNSPIEGGLVAMLIDREQINEPTDMSRHMVGMKIDGGIIPAGRAVNYTPPINSKISLTDAGKNVLKQGASDTFIRGFFYGPTIIQAGYTDWRGRSYPDNSANNFYVSYGSEGMHPIPFGSTRDVGSGSQEIVSQDATAASTNWNTGGQWSTIINLYSDVGLDKNKRFFSFSTVGIGKIYLYKTKNKEKPWTPNKYTPRVISLNDLGVSSSAILGVGTSATKGQSDYSVFDLKDINNLSPGLAGVFAFSNFANSNRNNQEKSVNLLTQFNPRAPNSFEQMHMREAKRAAQLANDGQNHNMGFRQYTTGAITHWQGNRYLNWRDGTDGQYSPIGLSNLTTSGHYGSEKMVLFDAPTRTPVSIGQLMHANLMNTSEISWRFDGVQGWDTNQQQVHTTPAYAIGNSIANVHLPLNQTRASVTQSSNMFDKPIKVYPQGGWPGGNGGINLKGSVYDYSYELNNALWDEYFFSGLEPDNIKFPLPNSQIKRRPINEGSNSSAQDLELKDERLAAAHLMLDGAFNINSTSVAAWESILGAMRDIYSLGEGVSDPSEQLHNYSRFVSPIMKSVTSPFSDPEVGSSSVSYSSDHEAIMAGYRSLTDKEIAKLAEKLVDEIRRRSSVKEHPFLSLSDFINRSIDQEDFEGTPARKRFMYTGALQSAIDQSGLNGRTPFNALGDTQTNNDGLWEDGYIYEPYVGASAGGSSQYYPYLEDSVAAIDDRPLMEGAPGFLMQADALSKIGGKLNARSDTFMIRSYGNSTEPLTGSNKAESYFEIVVQRTPEYLDSDPASGNPPAPATDAPESLNSLNEDFGRRYEIVSQRWINKADI